MDAAPHVPVLLSETIEGMGLSEGSVVMDCTAGFGGHAAQTLSVIGESGRLVLVDQDRAALDYCARRFENAENVTCIHKNFSDISREDHPWLSKGMHAALIDCGVSSLQLDDLQRGFSFESEVEPDMRMNSEKGFTAKEWLMRTSEEDISRILREYSDERFSGRIARNIKEAIADSRIRSAKDLAEVIRQSVPGRFRYGRIHPATKSFQAIRMAVNDELNVLDKGICNIIDMLMDAGRLAVITFHSVEDRLVKKLLRQVCSEGAGKLINKKVIKAGRSEIADNRRARSAKLRIFEKMEGQDNG